MKKIKRLLIASVSLCAFGPSQAEVREDGQYWFAITAQGGFGSLDPSLKPFRWWLEGQARFFDDGDHFGQGIIRTALGYSVTEATAVWLGYGWFPSSPVDGEDFDEQRIWQQLTWSTPTAIGKLSTRTRTEQRLVQTGRDTGWRVRHMTKLIHPLAFEPRLSLVAYDEIFVNLNDTDWGADAGLDQNRFFAGMGWNFDRDKHIRTELGYQNQFVDGPGGNDQVNHMLLLNVLLNY